VLYTIRCCDIFPMARCFLVLEDGTVMDGHSFGNEIDAFGDLVFSTGMGGYQESLTDPSSCGTLIVAAYPLIGNYGICGDTDQSDHVRARGLVVREYCEQPSPMYGGRTIDSFLREQGVPGISGIDTRELVIRIRENGTMRGAIVHREDMIKDRIKELRKTAPETNFVAEVSSRTIRNIGGTGTKVGVLDCGIRSGLAKELTERFSVTVFPYDTAAQEIIDGGTEGVIVSGGPGNPAHPDIENTVIRTIKDLSPCVPIMGISFGNLAIAAAFGGDTYKMKFGHHGCNQPVRYGGRVYMTSQSHGYAVNEDSLGGTGLAADQTNISDGTAEGIAHRDLPIFGVQYHPEASPGPSDTAFMFDRFKKMLEVKR